MPQQAGTKLGIRGAIDRAPRRHGALQEPVESGMVASQNVREGSRHQGCLLNASPSPPWRDVFHPRSRIWDTRLFEQVIYFELHQHLVPETRAGHPVGGECLLGAMAEGRQCLVGQRGADLSQPLSLVPRIALLVDLRPAHASLRGCPGNHLLLC
jgi:hypothetical protein